MGKNSDFSHIPHQPFNKWPENFSLKPPWMRAATPHSVPHSSQPTFVAQFQPQNNESGRIRFPIPLTYLSTKFPMLIKLLYRQFAVRLPEWWNHTKRQLNSFPPNWSFACGVGTESGKKNCVRYEILFIGSGKEFLKAREQRERQKIPKNGELQARLLFTGISRPSVSFRREFGPSKGSRAYFEVN